MPYIETYYDYEIHRECFRVSDTASYTHSTDTILNLSNTASTVTTYFVATFSLDVIRNVGDSKVAIYDNDTLLQIIDFNENTAKITNLTLNLNYNVEHNIEARYLGNDECLPSKSRIVPVLLEVPESFITKLSFTNLPNGNAILNPSAYEEFDLLLTDNDDNPIEGATIKLYVDDPDEGSRWDTVSTDENGMYNIYSIRDWDSSHFGVHKFKAVYEPTPYHFGTEAEIEIYVGYIATLTPTKSKYIVGQTPSFEIETRRYDEAPVSNMNVTLWRGD